MDVPEFLAQRDVLVDVDVKDKAALLHQLAQQAAGELELNAPEIANALYERENLGSTGTGGGIAIPHARLSKVKRPIGVFARTKKAIGFDAIDDKPVDLVFLLLLPSGSDGRYLSALASVARRLRNAATQARLRKADSQADLFAILCEPLSSP
jgi:PTS system nitrogen regulatory IIA component